MAGDQHFRTRRGQPPWNLPDAVPTGVLKLFNSLTRSKEIFIPQNGNRVSWYNCGPTVYDASHMGHARSYISFDILRRVLQNYFGFEVFFVMNITDIDDKIIKRARQAHLFAEYQRHYTEGGRSVNELLKDGAVALERYRLKLLAEHDPDKQAMFTRIIASSEAALTKSVDESALWDALKDPLSDWLDSEKGASVTDHSIFSQLARVWEEEFFNDMKALNVLPPDVVTRVSEYIAEIIEFIEKIITLGFAYESAHSVYFDTVKFDKSDGHFYAKLVPEAFGDENALREGEGDLTVFGEGEKRSSSDFALWKASKAGEPAWDSPWGRGRPGWHIECSVMASALLGSSMDIHSGGYDLKFPHHDNELAQSEAYFGNDNWVRYFLHSGHLTISGCKMSKSLKNFVTIKDALKKNTARQLRLAFLLHQWKDTLDYSENTMEMATLVEKQFNEFFLSVKNLLRLTCSLSADYMLKWNADEIKLNEAFQNCRSCVHAALCDNVDTRSALNALREIVSLSNVYMQAKKSCKEAPNVLLLKNVASYITYILRTFGVIETSEDIGFPAAKCADYGKNAEAIVTPFLSALAMFRDEIRIKAREAKHTNILEVCDRLRDTVLPDLGVRLEDHEGEPSVIKLSDRDTLIREREARQRMEEKKRAEKELRKSEQEALTAERERIRQIPPQDLFRGETNKYSVFDEYGLPTHDASGLEISKGLYKKLKKMQQAHEKKYLEYIASASAAEGDQSRAIPS